ncbi:hypothetical protein [Methylomonas koyamae]|nr:hypothetical protein [Methylomonas koyamae]WNB76444.1 hypothetical protein RI210_02390 [Methylomonas koyamae]
MRDTEGGDVTGVFQKKALIARASAIVNSNFKIVRFAKKPLINSVFQEK